MGFMERSGDSTSATIHAIHTTNGRRMLSSNDELYEITQFCFADDEINYQFMDSDLSIDESDDDLAQWPILEPSSNARNEMKNKIWVNKVIDDSRFDSSLPESGQFVRVELTTGSQGILNTQDNAPMFMSAIQTIITNSSTLQREIRIDSYEITINNTGNYIMNNKDFFDFMIFEMVSPIETSTYLKRTNSTGGIKYVFNTRNSAGQRYTTNQLGIRIVELAMSLDAGSQQYKNWVSDWRIAQKGDLLYPNMVTIKAISNILNFDEYTIDVNTKSTSFDVYVKV